MFKKGIDVIVLHFDDTVFINVTFFESTPFSLSSTVTSQGEDDDLLVYTISSPTPTPTPAPVPIKPLITQVYSQRQNPPVSSPTLATLSLDPIQNDDLPIALRTSKQQCAYPISSFDSYNHFRFPLVPLLHLLIQSLFQTLSGRLYLTLVGVVLW